ncbi:MAG: FxLYD domain-containing protein [Pseudomonadota bacterium]
MPPPPEPIAEPAPIEGDHDLVAAAPPAPPIDDDSADIDEWQAALGDDPGGTEADAPDSSEPGEDLGALKAGGLLDEIDADTFAAEGIHKVSEGDAVPEEPVETSKESLTKIEANVASALAAAKEAQSIEAVAARTAQTGTKAGSATPRAVMGRRLAGMMSLAASLLLAVGLVTLREPIVRAVPDLAGFYRVLGLNVNLRGLAFRDLRILREYREGRPVFIVEGLIENVSGRTIRLPDLQFSLLDDADSELYSWTTALSLTALAAGEVTRFKTEVATAPPTAADIRVRFSDPVRKRAAL